MKIIEENLITHFDAVIKPVMQFLQAKTTTYLVSLDNPKIQSELEIELCFNDWSVNRRIEAKTKVSKAQKTRINEIRNLPSHSLLIKELKLLQNSDFECQELIISLIKCIRKQGEPGLCQDARKHVIKIEKKRFGNEDTEKPYRLNPEEWYDEDVKFDISDLKYGGGFIIADALGVYYAHTKNYTNRDFGKIVLLCDRIIDVAQSHNIDPIHLLEVVLVHEMAHAYHHIGIDEMDRINHGFGRMTKYVLEGFANYMVFSYIEDCKSHGSKKARHLEDAFLNCTCQIGQYKAYKRFIDKRINFTQMNMTNSAFRAQVLTNNGLNEINFDLFWSELRDSVRKTGGKI